MLFLFSTCGFKTSKTKWPFILNRTNLTVELIIPSYNRLNILKETLKQIRVLYPDINICLGLQGEMPDSHFQSKLEGDSNIRLEKLPTPSTTKSLNHCISTSSADICLLLDDDSIPCAGWLESHLSAFTENPQLAYTCGREIRNSESHHAVLEWFRISLEMVCGLFLNGDAKLNGRIVGWLNWSGLLFGNFNQPGLCTINSPRGCNMALRKESFLKIGKFNQDFKGNAWGFEADFGLRMAKDGKYGLYLGNAIVIHQESPSGGSRSSNKRQWFNDFLYNHTLVVKHLGPQAWIGSAPRLLKNFFKTIIG